MKKNIIISFLLSIMLLSFASPVFAGLGISPSDWIEPNSLVGQQMTKTFMLSRSDAGQDLYFTSEITGDITPWIKIDNGDNFIMPKGTQEFPVKIIVTIPADAPFKNYKAEIRLKSETKEVAGAGSAPIGVLLSSLIRIDFAVSDKPFLNYSVLQISIPEQDQSKLLNVNLKIWNQGNVIAKPTKITMDIFDKFNTTLLGSETFTDFSTVTGVVPFSEGEIKLQIPISLQLTPEQYWAKVDVYQDDNVIKSDNVTFDIKGIPQAPIVPSTQQETNNLWDFINTKNILFAFGGIIIIVLIGLGILLLARKSRKNNTGTVVSGPVVGGVAATPSLQDAKNAKNKVIKEIEGEIDEFLEKKINE